MRWWQRVKPNEIPQFHGCKLNNGEIMSRQIQIRRGTAAEHEKFTGAIGEITMDTTNKTLRVHDGETAGGTALAKSSQLPPASADYVIETQLPTAQNNYTWYRKYKSGWVEMGGQVPVQENTITLPIELCDENYTVIIAYKLAGSNESSITFTALCTHTQTTTGFTVRRSEQTLKGWRISYMSA